MLPYLEVELGNALQARIEVLRSDLCQGLIPGWLGKRKRNGHATCRML